MLTLLIRLFAPDAQGDPQAHRGRLGTLASALGIGLNGLLFVIKLVAGLAASSIAITADAFNSLSDAASSLVTLIAFLLADRRPDPHHPFGHGRLEYVSGLVVSMLVMMLGFNLLSSAINQIIHPQEAAFSPLTAGILVVSIGIKGYMCLYNRALGRRLDSSPLKAASMDSLGDMLATLVVLAASLIGWRFDVRRVDGIGGLAVSLFILYSGVSAARETVSQLLGEAPSPDVVAKIQRDVMAGGHVLGYHDLAVHDYGPGRRMISLHAEVPADGDWLSMHDEIDAIEQKLKTDLNCDAVIHMDPVQLNDPRLPALRDQVTHALQSSIDPRITVHDMRMAGSGQRVRLIFDVLAPYDLAMTDEALKDRVVSLIAGMDSAIRAVPRIDRG